MENTQPTKKRVASSEADGAASTKKQRVSADSKAEQEYRQWAEVLVSGMYTDTQNPPPYPMFGKARKLLSTKYR